LAAERRAAIEEMVAEIGFAPVGDLALHFGRDSSTIRRDLESLEEQGRLRRVHGGAIPALDEESKPAESGRRGCDERIAEAVASAIADGETVCLGPGRLPLAVAHALQSKASLTIITNSLESAYWLSSHTDHNVIVAGGQVEPDGLGLGGELARSALRALRAERVVLEAGGVSAVGGVTADSLSQAEIARLLLDTGAEIVILVAPERVGRVAAVHVAPVSDVDVIATAREASSAHLWDLSELGVRIVLA
jgi:DeoR/GlpR family transcriptional regulator of sugar metabolism